MTKPNVIVWRAGVNCDRTTDVHHQASIFRRAMRLEEQTICARPWDEVTLKCHIDSASVFTKIHCALYPAIQNQCFRMSYATLPQSKAALMPKKADSPLQRWQYELLPQPLDLSYWVTDLFFLRLKWEKKKPQSFNFDSCPTVAQANLSTYCPPGLPLLPPLDQSEHI